LDSAPSDSIYDNPELEFTAPAVIRVKGNTYVTPIETTSATVIATCQGHKVAATKLSEKVACTTSVPTSARVSVPGMIAGANCCAP
jgi:hypothetical protein